MHIPRTAEVAPRTTAEAGHTVRVYVGEPACHDIFAGTLTRVADWREHLALAALGLSTSWTERFTGTGPILAAARRAAHANDIGERLARHDAKRLHDLGWIDDASYAALVDAMNPEPIGWLASCVLLVTLIIQVRKQWREHTSRGLSPWLYVGQLVASTGFLVYSALVGDAVFVATNALLMVVNGGGGLMLVRIPRKRSR